MNDITNNEMRFVLSIFKSPEKELNTSEIAKLIGISPMGALKIARKLEKEGILKTRKFGKGTYYYLNFENDYVKKYLIFLLRREAEQAKGYERRWIHDIRKITQADAAILFGSVLRVGDKANDIDVLIVTDNKRIKALKKELEEINQINIKRIHPMYQTKRDIRRNIKKGDKPLLSALNGLVVFGEERIVEVLKK